MSLLEEITARLEECYELGTRLGDMPNSADADEILGEILDAAVEAQFHAATELGIDRQAKHYLEEATNKLREKQE